MLAWHLYDMIFLCFGSGISLTLSMAEVDVDQNQNTGEQEAEQVIVAEAEQKEVRVEEKKWPGWPGESVFRMLVPAQKVGGIIGRKGEFIKKIVEETRARVKILDGPPGNAERAVSPL